MPEEKVFTRVTYRRWNAQPRSIIAFLWGVDARPGKVTCYEHIGQHGEADLGIVRLTTLAHYCPGRAGSDITEADVKAAADLNKELESLGYQLALTERRPHRRG
jgi:hypothetical protein